MSASTTPRAIRWRYAGYSARVVLISAEATPDKVKMAVQKGAAGSIVKPFNSGTVPDELRLCLQETG